MEVNASALPGSQCYRGSVYGELGGEFCGSFVPLCAHLFALPLDSSRQVIPYANVANAFCVEPSSQAVAVPLLRHFMTQTV